MAAYAALTSLSETTQLLLRKIIFQKTTDGDGVLSSRNLLLQQLEDEIESLRKDTDFLRSFLEKSPDSQFEAQMKDAADRAQAIISRLLLDQLRLEMTTVDDVTLESISHQLKRMHEDLNSSMVEKINDRDDEEEESVGIFDSSTLPHTRINLFFGTREEEFISKLYRNFFDKSSTELRVVSILGMGGMGKTTIAQIFYSKTASLGQSVIITGWVTVSKHSSARDILTSLMASIQPFIGLPKRNESIENYVHNKLKGRRFFIVLDNVWSPEVLRVLMRTFPDDGNGSGILITTRREEVAAVVADPQNPSRTITMRPMNPHESRTLLESKVFHGRRCPSELADLLRSITMVCEGLPLAIVLVAGILFASNRSPREWRYIFEKLSVGYKSQHEMVESVLSLSYRHLPHHLRSCLLYMGAFPEDHKINVARLAKILSAQGFRRETTRYEVEECVQHLINRNLASVLRWKTDRRIQNICLHDMVRDFCLKKAQEEKFLHYVTEDDDSDQDLAGRRMKVCSNSGSLKHICNSSDDGADDDTHTIMCFGSGRIRIRPLISIGRFKLLKSLDLPNLEIESLPNELVLNLSLLRLLALGHVPELPPSISNLQHLETLIVNTATDTSPSSSSMTTLPRVLCLPSEIWTMSQIRHIVSFCCGPLPSPNREENSPLENLETLSAVMNLDKDLIEMIPNVKKLGIFYYNVGRATHSVENIERLRRLEKLKLWVLVPFSSPQNLNLSSFPNTLRKLTLRGIRLSHGDMLVVGRLPRLRVLKLRRDDFEGDEWRIETRGFENLEYLLLKELGLRRWLRDGGEGVVFPMLRLLVIRNCKQLNEIEEVVENIPSLEVIEVVGNNSKSLVESAKRMKEGRHLEVHFTELIFSNPHINLKATYIHENLMMGKRKTVIGHENADGDLD